MPLRCSISPRCGFNSRMASWSNTSWERSKGMMSNRNWGGIASVPRAGEKKRAETLWRQGFTAIQHEADNYELSAKDLRLFLASKMHGSGDAGLGFAAFQYLL